MTRLSRDQLRELSGRQRSNGVRHWLVANGWNGMNDADGWPIVYREWFEKRTGQQLEYDIDVAALKAA